MKKNTQKEKQISFLYDILPILFIFIGLVTFNPLIVLLAGLIFVTTRKIDAEFALPKLSLPDNFFKLSPAQREETLKYAWNEIDKVINTQKERVVHYAKNIKKFSILFALYTITLFLFIAAMDEYINDSENHTSFFIFLFFLGTMFFYLYKNRKLKKENEYMAKYLQEKDLYNEKLEKLARDFVVKYHPTWLDTTKKYIDKEIVTISKTQPENIYTLFSYDYTQNKNKMPPKSVYLTYILISKDYMTIISNIEIKIKDNSFRYVKSDSPTLIAPNKSDWNIKEFFYKDIIEIDYVSNNYNKEKGNLIVGLVNGNEYPYPTLKRYTQNLFEDVREKMRKAKTT